MVVSVIQGLLKCQLIGMGIIDFELTKNEVLESYYISYWFGVFYFSFGNITKKLKILRLLKN